MHKPDKQRPVSYGFFNPETGKGWADLEEAKRFFEERQAREAQQQVGKRSHRKFKPWGWAND